jgi:hypothetical protein
MHSTSPKQRNSIWEGMMKRSTRLIGVLEIMAAGVFFATTLTLMVSATKNPSWSIFAGIAMGLAATLLNLSAGVLLLTTEKKAGYILSIINTSLQVLIFNVPGLVYLYSGLGQIIIGVSTKGLELGANIFPGRFFVNNVPTGPSAVSINVLALAFVIFLWRAFRAINWERREDQNRFDPRGQ